MKPLITGWLGPALLLCVASLPLPVRATVIVSGPDDGSAFFPLFRPTGQFDETGLSGFEFFISSTTGQFNSNDLYLIQGEDTNELQSIANDIGAVGDMAGVTFNFSIQHHLTGGRNFTFSVTNATTADTSVLCWGQNCPAGSHSAALINNIAPIVDYNGLQVQVRAQDVANSSAAVKILGLSGVTLSGSPLFDETVTPSSPGTISPLDAGRRGQWFMANANDLTANEWELFGTVKLDRPDEALVDRNKVRLAVDFVRNEELPFVPEPSTGPLVGLGIAVLAARRARVRSLALSTR